MKEMNKIEEMKDISEHEEMKVVEKKKITRSMKTLDTKIMMIGKIQTLIHEVHGGANMEKDGRTSID